MDDKRFNYFVTFDLTGAKKRDYDLVYEHFHLVGGYRYFLFPSGRLGFLPGSSVVITFWDKEVTPAAAGNKFREVLTRMGLVISRLSVSRGEPEMVEARVVRSRPSWLCGGCKASTTSNADPAPKPSQSRRPSKSQSLTAQKTTAKTTDHHRRTVSTQETQHPAT